MPATVWQGRLTFGLVTVPVRLYKAARRERTKFHHVYRAPEPLRSREHPVEHGPHLVRQAEIDKQAAQPAPPQRMLELDDSAEAEAGPVVRVHSQPVSGGAHPATVEKSRILKGYEIEEDRYAVFEPAELAALRPRPSTELEIVEFVHLNEIDPVYFDVSYYVVPNQGGEKPYAVLFRALKESGYVALGTLAMHGREHATVIRPGHSGLILHTMFYSNEVRTSEEYRTDPQLVSAKELELAKMLVNATAATFDPAKLKDTFEERVRALIASRAHAAVPLQGSPEQPAAAPVVDIMEALRRSLEAVRKPAGSESHAGRGKARARRGTGRAH